MADSTDTMLFWSKVARSSPDGCWPWTGRLTPLGYGRYGSRGAHRIAYELLVGPIPVGLELDHLCRNRACVNPAHLEPVTHAVNTRRGLTASSLNAAKTECPNGHAYTDENTYRYPNGGRECRECKRAKDRRRQHLANARRQARKAQGVGGDGADG